MQSPNGYDATQATLAAMNGQGTTRASKAAMNNQGGGMSDITFMSTADLSFDSTRGSKAYLASTDSHGRLLQDDPRQDAQIRAQNSQRQAQIQASGNETVSKWNTYSTFDDGSEDQGNLFDGQSHRYQSTTGPIRGSGRGILGPRPQPVNRAATPYTPRSTPTTFDGLRGPVPTGPSGRGGCGSPSHRGRGSPPRGRGGRGTAPTGPSRHGPAPVGLRQRADSPSRYGTIRDLGGRRERQPTPPRHGGVARQPGARPIPQLTLSHASDNDHSKEFDKKQDASRLQVPPRVSRAGNLNINKDSGKVQNATRSQVQPRVSRVSNPSGNPLIAQWQQQPVRPTQSVCPTQPTYPTHLARPTQSARPTQATRPVQPQSELEMSKHKVDSLWAAAYRADCDFLETSMVSQETDGPAIARAKILTIYSALTSEGVSEIVSKIGPQWECIHDHARWCFVKKAFWIAFGGGFEQTSKIAEMTKNFTEFGKLWQDARDAINEANVIIKAKHLIPASMKKWKDMDKLDILEEALKRTEEAANAAEVEDRDDMAGVAAVYEMDAGESGLAAQTTGDMADMSIRVDTSIEQSFEYLDNAVAQIYGTTTTISGPGVQPASSLIQSHPSAYLRVTQGSMDTGLVDVQVPHMPSGMDVTLAVELEGDSPPLTRNLWESYVEALARIAESLARGNQQAVPAAASHQAYCESDSDDTAF